jgi:hypothetical protein
MKPKAKPSVAELRRKFDGYTHDQVEAAIAEAVDRDRIENFLLFVKNMPPGDRLVYGTNRQIESIARALARAGYR